MTSNKQERGKKTIDRVLDAALEGFVAHRALPSIQELSQRSGVSVGSIYHHFGAMDGVMFALYRRCLEAMLSAISAAVVVCAGAREGVYALVRAYLDFVAEHPDEARLIYAAAHAAMLESQRAELTALAERVVAPIAQWLSPHIEAGRVRALPPPLLEVVLIGPAAEASRRILSGAPGLTLASAREVLPELTWRSVQR